MADIGSCDLAALTTDLKHPSYPNSLCIPGTARGHPNPCAYSTYLYWSIWLPEHVGCPPSPFGQMKSFYRHCLSHIVLGGVFPDDFPSHTCKGRDNIYRAVFLNPVSSRCARLQLLETAGVVVTLVGKGTQMISHGGKSLNLLRQRLEVLNFKRLESNLPQPQLELPMGKTDGSYPLCVFVSGLFLLLVL